MFPVECGGVSAGANWYHTAGYSTSIETQGAMIMLACVERYCGDMSSCVHTHRKKRLATFPSPGGMSLTKLSMGRKMFIIPAPRDSLVSDIPQGTGMSLSFFYSAPCECEPVCQRYCHELDLAFDDINAQAWISVALDSLFRCPFKFTEQFTYFFRLMRVCLAMLAAYFCQSH